MENTINEKKYQRKEKNKGRVTVALFLTPYFLNFTIFFLIPLIMGVVISFMHYDPYVSDNNYFVGFKNYTELFSSGLLKTNFWDALWTTIKYDIVAVPVMVIFPLFLAYLINYKPPGYKIFRALIYLPTVVSISIVGVVFGAIFDASPSGLMNNLFGTEITWLDGSLRWVVILIASVWWQTGINFIIFSAALNDVPKPLYEACRIDGGGKWKSFTHVTLPNIKTALELCLFNTLIGYLQLYGQPYVLNTYYNKTDIDTPMMFIQSWLNDFSKSSLTGLISSAAIVFGLIVIAFTVVEKIVMRNREGGKNVYAKKFAIYSETSK